MFNRPPISACLAPNLASGRVATAADWVEATGQGSIHTLAEPQRVERPGMPNVGYPLPSLAQVRRFVASPARVATLPGATVCGREGTVVTADGCLVEDLTRAWGRAIEDHPIWAAPADAPSLQLEGTAAVVAARGAADNFSHFLADTLPRIQLIRDTGLPVDTWLLSGTHHAWQRQALDLAAVLQHEVVSLSEHPLVRASRLLVPSRTGFAPMTAPWARERLRALLPQPRLQLRPPRRVLISRANAARRRLVNEDDLAAALAPDGFERLAFEHLNLEGQTAAIAGADIIVAPHGAALAHLLHAPPGGHLLEICHPPTAHPDYWGLAALAGWTHRLIPATSSAQHGNHEDMLYADLHVTPAAVLAVLDEILPIGSA